MQRRTFLKIGTLSAGAMAAQESGLGRILPGQQDGPVRRVLLVTMCHLDVGFSLTQAQVMRKYFDVYFPQAIDIAAKLRRSGSDRYVWTTGAWLLYEYLEQASAVDRQRMEQAVAAGDITWHALPFNWQTEMIDRSMIEGAMGFSATLDQRFGHKTIGGKMTDVPGHSRGLIAPLAASGVRMLDIGVNAASTPPDVPNLFLWKDSAGNSLAMMYHRHDYGGILRIPGTDVAVDIAVRNDNSGPHTFAEIAAMYAQLRAQFPGASIEASNFNAVAAAVDEVRASLPVVTEEIGDTWIYGVASDPVKVARYREAARARRSWIAQKKFAVGDHTDRQLLRRLTLAPEHTWGTDTKSYLDDDHYRPADLAKVLNQPGYRTMEVSWQEKRQDIDTAIDTLPPVLRIEMQQRLAALQPQPPGSAGMARHDPAQPIVGVHFTLAFDPVTGAITSMRSHASGHEFASSAYPLALFTYQTLSAAEYAAFLGRYIKIKSDWAPKDFGKPGIEKFGAVAQEWHPRLSGCWVASDAQEDRILLQSGIEDAAAEATGNVAWPQAISCEIRMPKTEPRVELTLTTAGKIANRMPEAMWLTFRPVGTGQRAWTLDKVDEPVSPADVIRGGGRSMHAITNEVRFAGASGSTLRIQSLDAPLVAVGGRSPLNFSLELPNLLDGVHFGLFNNAWGTNYIQWCAGDWRYRFSLEE